MGLVWDFLTMIHSAEARSPEDGLSFLWRLHRLDYFGRIRSVITVATTVQLCCVPSFGFSSHSETADGEDSVRKKGVSRPVLQLKKR